MSEGDKNHGRSSDGEVIENRRFFGNVDGLQKGVLFGWAVDSKEQNSPCDLRVWLDGREIAALSADQYREDVAAAGFGSGHCGFQLDLTDALADGRVHEIKVVADAGFVLGAASFSPYVGRVDVADDAASVRGWVGNLYDPYKLISVDLVHAGVVISSVVAQEELDYGPESGIEEIGAGFRFKLSDELLADEPRAFDVVVSGTAIHLEGSPLTVSKAGVKSGDSFASEFDASTDEGADVEKEASEEDSVEKAGGAASEEDRLGDFSTSEAALGESSTQDDVAFEKDVRGDAEEASEDSGSGVSASEASDESSEQQSDGAAEGDSLGIFDAADASPGKVPVDELDEAGPRDDSLLDGDEVVHDGDDAAIVEPEPVVYSPTQEELEAARLAKVRGHAIRLRKALERQGLWLSSPLVEAEAADLDIEQICFDDAYYASIAASLPANATSSDALAHFLERAAEAVTRPNAIFDEFWYVRRYGDALQAIVQGRYRSGLEHFLHEGLAADYSPSVWFEPAHYLGQLLEPPSPEDDLQSAFLHFLEQRGPTDASPAPAFDAAWYLAAYPDAREQIESGRVGSALAHYLREGAARGYHAAPGLEESRFVSAEGVVRGGYEWSLLFGASAEDGVQDADRLFHRNKTLVILNTNTQTRNSHITRAIVAAAEALLGAANVRYVNYANVVTICASLDRPILLCIDGQRINTDIVRQARRWAAATALWTFDDPYNLKSHLEVAALFDAIFTNDAGCAEAYGQKGFFLPLAAPVGLAQTSPARHDFDLFFCGTAWPNRVALVNKLMRDRPHLRFKLVLAYNPHLPPLPVDLPTSTYVDTLAFADYIRYAQRSKITLALHRNFSGTDTIGASSSPGPRVFEIGAAGAFQISENGGPDFERLFDQDTLTYFSNYADLLEKLDRLLADDAERESRAARLQRLIARRHTYKHRLSVILTETERRRRIDAPVPADVASRPKILYAVHNTIQSKSFGGLEIHQDILMQNLKKDHDIFFFYTTTTGENERTAILADHNYRTLASVKIKLGIMHGYLEIPQLERFFGECIQKHQFDLVHFFHFLNSVPSLAHVARAYGVPYVISVHDFYIGCRSFNLLNYHGNYCHNDMTKIDDCDICLSSLYKFPPGSQIVRRDYYGEVLQAASALIFMSGSTRDIMEGIYPEIQQSPMRRIHGAPIPNPVWPVQRRMTPRQASNGERPVRFVLLGNFQANKGAAYLHDALIPCETLDAEFHFHGAIDNNHKDRLTRLIKSKAVFHGAYAPGSLNLGQYDFSLHLSNWPETYCQTLSEAWASRLVPIVTDIGALGERVQHGVNGFKVDPDQPGALTRLLKAIVEDPAPYLAISSNISDALFLKQPAHAKMYQDVYEAVLQARPPRRREDVANVAPSGASIAVLQRYRRNALWNSNRVTHPEDKPTLPDRGLLSRRNSLSAFSGEPWIGSGNFEFAGRGRKATNEVHETIRLRNGEALTLVGWVSLENCPPERRDEVTPVALIEELQPNGARYLHPLARERRPDVAAFFENETAADWGMAGSIRLLAPDEIIIGSVDIRLGWLDSASNALYTTATVVQAIGVYGG